MPRAYISSPLLVPPRLAALWEVGSSWVAPSGTSTSGAVAIICYLARAFFRQRSKVYESSTLKAMASNLIAMTSLSQPKTTRCLTNLVKTTPSVPSASENGRQRVSSWTYWDIWKTKTVLLYIILCDFISSSLLDKCHAPCVHV